MSRSRREFWRRMLCSLTCWMILGFAGCSSEPPPIAAIRAGAASPANAANAELTAGNEASSNGDAEPGAGQDATATSAPDTAVLTLLQGLSANRPDALWEALPESYQNDVSSLISRFAARLHPEAWRWFVQVAGKSRGLLPEDDSEGAARRSGVSLLEWLASGEQADLERLKHPDLGRFLRTRGRLVMADVRQLVAGIASNPEFDAALRDIAGPLPDVFQDPSLLRTTVKSAEGDDCVLEIQLPVKDPVLADLYKFDMEFVRVEGKWVPRWLADNWSGLVAAAGEIVDLALPSEHAHDNFGIIFRYLAQLDSMIEFELAAQRGEQAVEPTLFDVVDYLLGIAEDLGLPIPAELRGGEVDPLLDSADDSQMSTPEGKPSNE